MMKELMSMPHVRFKYLLFLTLFFLVSCAAPTKTEIKHENTPKLLSVSNESVVLFPTYSELTGSHEADFVGCLVGEIEKQISNQIKIIDRKVFQDALFPWFEVEHAPSTTQDLTALLSRGVVKERIASLGIRYIVNIASSTDADGFPGMNCGSGYGCFGLFWGDKIHRVNVVIWDVHKGIQVGDISTETSGRSSGFAFIIPIVFVADTEGGACEAVATELAQILNGTISSN